MAEMEGVWAWLQLIACCRCGASCQCHRSKQWCSQQQGVGGIGCCLDGDGLCGLLKRLPRGTGLLRLLHC